MCGRIVGGDLTQAEMLAIIEGYVYPSRPVKIDNNAPVAAKGYNIAPTQQVNVIFEEKGELIASTARWWLVPHWFREPVENWRATTFNAKIETAAEKPTFRDVWKRGRCLIPAMGYYEWSGPKNKRQPNYISIEQNHPVMLFAGLQAVHTSGQRTCAILTRDALPEIADIHDRMPVILTAFEAEHWLSHADEDSHIKANYGLEIENRLLSHRVAKFGTRDDGPGLIESIDGLF